MKKDNKGLAVGCMLVCVIILVGTLILTVLTSRTMTFSGKLSNDYEKTVAVFSDPSIAVLDSYEYTDGRWRAVIVGKKVGTTEITITNIHKEDPEIADHLHSSIYVGPGGFILEIGRLDFDGLDAFCAGNAALFLCLGVFLMAAYQRRKAAFFYNYGTPVTLGISLFCLAYFLLFAFLFVYVIMMGDDVNAEQIFTVTQYALSGFILVSLPFVLLYGLLMWISNVWLVRHEGMIKTNLLAFLLGGLMMSGAVACLILAFVNSQRIFFDTKEIYLSIARTVISSLYLYFSLMLIATQYCCIIACRRKVRHDADYIIILGCAIKKDGSLYPLIRGRADRAIEFFKEQTERTGKSPVFVPSGGQGSDEVMPEAEAVRRYLIEQGIDENMIIAEARSTNTLENMKFSKEIIESRKKDSKVVFSTTNYHVFRSGIFASQVGLNAEGIGSGTKWYFWPNAQIREFIGMLSKSYKLHIVLIVLIVLASLIISNFGSLLHHLIG